MNHYFKLFHETMKVFAYKARGTNEDIGNMVFRQKTIYNSLFYWQAEECGAEKKVWDDIQISRWVTGKEVVPQWIVSHIISDRLYCIDKYSAIFKKFTNDGLFQSGEIEAQLTANLLELLNDWQLVDDYPNKCELWEALAITFTAALIFDYALSKNKLDTKLNSKLQTVIELCKTNNAEFKTPHIISVLMEDNQSLLWRTLNAISPNEWKDEHKFGNKFGAGILNYRNSEEHSNPYKEVELDKEKLLVLARVLSFLNGKFITDEFDVCYAIRRFHSKSLAQLESIMGECEYWKDDNKWCTKLLESQKPHTSSLYFPNDSQNKSLPVDIKNEKHGIMIAVATMLELEIACEQLKEVGTITQVHTKDISYSKSIIKDTPVFIVKCQMGAGGVGGALLAFNNALTRLKPEYAIMGGIAFGSNKRKQKIGDVLLSTKIWNYEPEKIQKDGSILRGTIDAASPNLIQMFEMISLDMNDIKLRPGLIASGEKLVDSKEFMLNNLMKKQPEIIGGDMEGAGFASACMREQTQWVLAKGICDWGYGKNSVSKKDDQKIAAVNSFRLIREAIIGLTGGLQ